MAEEMSRAEALELLRLTSPLELTVGHVQKMIDANPKAIESVYWDAFHVLKPEQGSFLDKEREANEIKARAKVQQELDQNSLVKSYELEKMRRELDNLVYEINNEKQLGNQFWAEIRDLGKCKKALANFVTFQKEKDDEIIKITESILDLENQIVSINNDKSETISQETKHIKIAKLKNQMMDLESKKSTTNSVSERELLCQQALLIQQSKCEDLRLKIKNNKIELLQYTETARIYSLVETNVCTYFIGPFSRSRVIADVNYLWGYSELGQALKGLKKGEFTVYNGQSLEILNISIPDIRWLQGLVNLANWEGDFLDVLPDWSPLGGDLRERISRPPVGFRNPGWANY